MAVSGWARVAASVPTVTRPRQSRSATVLPSVDDQTRRSWTLAWFFAARGRRYRLGGARCARSSIPARRCALRPSRRGSGGLRGTTRSGDHRRRREKRGAHPTPAPTICVGPGRLRCDSACSPCNSSELIAAFFECASCIERRRRFARYVVSNRSSQNVDVRRNATRQTDAVA